VASLDAANGTILPQQNVVQGLGQAMDQQQTAVDAPAEAPVATEN
jgi:hypothetical protein